MYLAASSQSLLAASANETILINTPPGVLAILLGILGVVFYAASRPVVGRLFKVIPALIFCYFVPTLFSTPWSFVDAAGNDAIFRVIPNASPLFDFVKKIVLPASLFLFTLNLDLKGIIRLGPKAGGMLLAGTLGVVIGGPIAVWMWQSQMPPDGQLPLAYLAGSWIGGGANAIALQKSFNVTDAAISPIIVVDVFIANCWMAVLLFFAGKPKGIDRILGGDTSAIDDLTKRMEDYHDAVKRHATIGDILAILALSFGGAWISGVAADALMSIDFFARGSDYVGAFAWKVIFVTILGVVCSFTKMRTLEGAGASRFGGVMIYLLVACIGAGADFSRIFEARGYMLIGATWMIIHITVLLIAAKLMKAPFFFVAVGSKANIGGAASAPVVAGAFNPVLAPVGALLAIAGYVLGTFAGLLCVNLMNFVLPAATAN